MGSFLISYGKTNKIESGYANVTNDNGGKTYQGISSVIFPSWEGWKLIDYFINKHGEPKIGYVFHEDEIPNLETKIQQFYRENFWDKIQGDKILNQDWCDNLYDTAVNQGIVSSIHFVQDTLGLPRTSTMNEETLNAINFN